MTFIQAHTYNQLLYKGKNSNIYLYPSKNYPVPTILKILTEEYPDAEKIAQFRNEYNFLKQIKIDGVRQAFETITTSDNKCGIILEYIQGETLQNAYTNSPPDVKTFLNISIQLAGILSKLHDKGIIHKDLNSNNVLIDEKRKKVTIIDFGISTKIKLRTQHLGNPEKLEGTLAYISPEQTGRMNRFVDYRTDMYSLGVTLYRLATGLLPFDYQDSLQLIHAHISKVPRSPHIIRKEIPEMVSRVILKLLAKNAEDRYQSAYGLKEDLKLCLEQYIETGDVHTFQLAEEDYSSYFQIPQKLYGRDKELSLMLDSFERVCEGTKEMLLVGGYSGVGKSALISELHKPITAKRGVFIEGKFNQFQKDVPYFGFIQAFNGLVKLLLSENDTMIAYWRKQILNAVGDLGGLLIGLTPKLKLIIGEQPSVSKLTGIEAQNRFNYVLQKFIGAIAQERHPLVLFIDDWQWADQASLDLLQGIITNTKSNHLLLICAYRNNETPNNHPFTESIAATQAVIQHKEKTSIQSLQLQNLSKLEITQLITDTLFCKKEFCEQLSKVVFEKTQGNAFFVRQFLTSLYEEGLIYFNSQNRGWEGKLEDIFQQDFTDNVVELMLKKVKKLPKYTLEKLKLAACIGNRFNIEALATLSDNASRASITENLLRAVIDGLIFSRNAFLYIEEYTDGNQEVIYQFAHDNIQKAFYLLINEEDKEDVHYKIGSLLLRKAKLNVSELLANNQKINEQVFEIVKHLNIGEKYITSEIEKNELATLNLLAGKKAKASAAYKAANAYLQQAIRLYGNNVFEKEYLVALDLYETAVEAAYMSNHNDLAQQIIATALTKVRSTTDSIRLRNVQIQSFVKNNQLPDAVRLGEHVLKDLGFAFPHTPNPLQIGINVLKTQLRLIKHPPESLFDYPEMSNKRLLAAMEILAPTATAAYWSKPNLMPLLILRMVQLSIKYGNNRFAPFAYSTYGIILCGVLGQIEKGYAFGQLALKLMNKYEHPAYQARTLMVVNQMIIPWREHLRRSLQPLKKASQTALEGGDVEMAGLIRYFQLSHSFVVGAPIHTLQQETEKSIEWIRELKQERVEPLIIMLKQVLENLSIPSNEPEKLSGIFYKESEMLAAFKNVNDINALCTHYLFHTHLALYFRKYRRALEGTQQMEAYLEAAVSTPIIPLYHFYNSLSYLGIWDELDKTEQKLAAKKISANQKKMRKWSEYAPMNFRHKYLLVEAERYRIAGNFEKARNCYDESIDLAYKSQYVQEEALAYELAARFYQQQKQKHLLRSYIQGAYESYRRWGGYARSIALRKEFPHYFEKTPLFSTIENTIASSSSGGFDSFDIQSFVRASQTISREMNLSRLMQQMMSIIIENAGAERGFFMLNKEQSLYIEVAYNYHAVNLDTADYQDLDNGIVKIDSRLVENIDSTNQVLSDKMVYYVARSRQTLVFNNAVNSEQFAKCIYIQKNQPKSVLCTPILNQGKVLGVLYLENNQVNNAFTQNRVELLGLLASQAAISLNNALLYDNLEQKVIERTKEISKQKEEIEKQKGKIEVQNRLIARQLKYKEQFFSNVSHELRTPLNGIMGMSNLLLDTSMNTQQKNYVEVINNSADNLLIIINDLLDIAKINAGKLKIIPQTFSLPVLLQDLNTLLQEKAKEKTLTLNYQLDSEIPEHLIGDKVRIYQVLINLLNNAIKFTKKGEVSLHANLVYKETDHLRLRFDVKDTGIGIASDKLDKIFGSFNQVIDKEGFHYEGTGLGLGIVQQLVMLMNGSLNVESKLGTGSTFSIELKLPIATNEQIEQHRKKRLQKLEASEDLSKKRLLILEDNKINQLVAKKLLQKYQFQLEIADDIAQARQKLSEQHFDCLLADIRLPDGDGIEFVAEIQQTEGHPNRHIPVIVLTAGTSEEEKNRSKDLAIHAYMSKPFNPNVLITHLKNIFQPASSNDSLLKQEYESDAFLQSLYERMESKAAVKETLCLFLEQVPDVIEKLEEAVTQEDWDTVYAEIQTVKSTIQMIGLENLEPSILKLEDYAFHLKYLEQISTVFNEFKNLSKEAISKIKKVLKSGKW